MRSGWTTMTELIQRKRLGELLGQLPRLIFVLIGSLVILGVTLLAFSIKKSVLAEPLPQSAQTEPILNIEKTGPITADVGSAVNYTFVVSHAESSDGSPVSNIIVEDDIAGRANLVFGDTNENDKLDADESWIYSAAYIIQPTDLNPLVNTVTVVGKDEDGNEVKDTDTHRTTLMAFAPVLDIQVTGPDKASTGDEVFYTFIVRHAETSDGSPISDVIVHSTRVTSPIYLAGDENENKKLDKGETWVYIAPYIIQPTDPGPLLNNISTVQGKSQDSVEITATDDHRINITRNLLCDVYVTDNFTNPGVWPVFENTELKTAYTGGEYSMVTKNPDIHFARRSDENFINYEVEVDARWLDENSSGNGYGIIFGLVEDDNQAYLFQVNSDRQAYRLLRLSDEGWSPLTNRDTSNGWVKADVIKDDPSASNRLKVIRIGSQIIMYVNNVILETILDDTIEKGNIGLGVERYDNDPEYKTRDANVLFDNYKISRCAATIK